MRLLIIWYSVALHFLWGGILLLSGQPYLTTGLGKVYELVPDARWLGVVMVLCGGSAVAGMHIPHLTRWFSTTLLLPQQYMLILTAASSLSAVIAGQFADGVPRAHLFILIDQSPAIMLVIFHTLAVIQHARWRSLI